MSCAPSRLKISLALSTSFPHSDRVHLLGLHLFHLRADLLQSSLVPHLADPREDLALLFLYVGLEACMDLLDLGQPLLILGGEAVDLVDQAFHLVNLGLVLLSPPGKLR